MATGKTAAKLETQNSPSRKKSGQQNFDIKSILMPDYMLLCQDFVRGVDNDLSIIKTIDFLKPDHLPYTPARLVLVATFFRLPPITADQFRAASPELRLTVHTPNQRIVEVGTFPVSEFSERDPWIMERLIVDLSDGIEFTMSGPYRFLIEGRTSNAEFEKLSWRLLPIAEPYGSKKPIARV